jgi:hypothetical protein
MAEYLAANYKNAKLRTFEGDHISAMFHVDELYEELLGL